MKKFIFNISSITVPFLIAAWIYTDTLDRREQAELTTIDADTLTTIDADTSVRQAFCTNDVDVIVTSENQNFKIDC